MSDQVSTTVTLYDDQQAFDADAGVESNRRLAHIERIEKLTPIPGADKIVKATVLGWECVVRLGEFREGDACCYIECDSIVPPKPCFEFLKDRKYRVKTARFKGQIAQGLAVPLSTLTVEYGKLPSYEIGYDLTTFLGIKKHDPQLAAELQAMASMPKPWWLKALMRFRWFRALRMVFRGKGRFPSWISKTDEERIQNMPGVAQAWAHALCYSTEKLDGQSATYAYRWPWQGGFYVCSRERRLLHKDNSTWWRIVEKYDLKRKLRQYRNIAIQGEIVGPNIQKNRYKLKDIDFYVFNMRDLQTGEWFDLRTRMILCETLGLKHVPLVNYCFVMDPDYTVQDFLVTARGTSQLFPRRREGIVVRRTDNDRLSFKAVDPEFLLETDT